MTNKNMAVIGECMLEIATGQDFPNNNASFSFGGDTLNVAVYCARLGGNVDFVTAMGDDDLSSKTIKLWKRENVGTNLVERLKGYLPGLYAVTNDIVGERNFLYWRDQSPARQLFKAEFTEDMIEKIIDNYDILYLSGITLSLFDDEDLEKLYDLTNRFRENGGKVAFDLNYRPIGWNHDTERARKVIGHFMTMVDIATTGTEDEKILWGDETTMDVINRYKDNGTEEIIIKSGADPTLFYDGNEMQALAPKETVTALDTTAAGDSFNGAYLAARLNGKDIAESIIYGQSCAAEVIKHRGAIIPKETTENILQEIETRYGEA